jgi:AcrR family transcriptional regulator
LEPFALAKSTRRRDPELTQTKLLKAATAEFAHYGFDGARVQRIVENAGCNMRMLYHYFGDKENLYVQVLEAVYSEIREKERELDLKSLEPRQAILRLVRFTWDHFQASTIFIDIARNENLVGGRFVRRSKAITDMSSLLIDSIKGTIGRGLKTGEFSHRVDALQLYVSIVALSSHHLNNVHTLSAVFGTDLSDNAWLQARRRHVEAMILRMLGTDAGK